MRNRESSATARDGPRQGKERGLSTTSFVGSYPTADFVLRSPLPEIAVVGRSNVGKSSLLNRLMGRRSLAHTSKTPGKTKMCNVYTVGDGFYLVDLPGYGFARASKIARRGFSKLVADYLSTRQQLVGVVWLLDIRRTPSAKDLEMADLLAGRGVPVLVAVTKADKIGRSHRQNRTRAILSAVDVSEDQCVVTSARTREGVDELRAAVAALIETYEES